MAEINDIIENELEAFAVKLVQDLQKSLRDKVSFGGQDSKLSNKIRYEITEIGDKVVMKLRMPSYGLIIDKGRKGGKGVSKDGQKNISEWIKRKGTIFPKFRRESLQARIDKQNEAKAKNRARKIWKKPKPVTFDEGIKQLTYLVSRKIKKEGFKGNHFYSDVIDKLNIEEVKQNIQERIKERVIIELKK